MFQLKNTILDSSFSRGSGGGIVIEPSNTQNIINFSNLIIEDNYAIKNSFLSFGLGSTNNIPSNINY